MRNMKLSPIDLTRLSNAELSQFISRFIDDFSKSGLNADTDEDLKKIITSMQGQLPNFISALDQVRTNEESSKVAKADKERDFAFRSIRDAIKPYKNTKDANEKTAYTALFLLISEYKGLEGNSYEAQTARLNNLVERLQSSAYTHHTNTLSVGKFVTRLSQANTEFEKVFANRSFLNAQKPTINASELRKELVDQYKKLSYYIVATANVKEDSFYRDTLTILNNSRKYFADTLLSRRNKKKETKKITKKEENNHPSS